MPQEIIFKIQQILYNDLMHNFNHWFKQITFDASFLVDFPAEKRIEKAACDILDCCMALQSCSEVALGLQQGNICNF